MYPLGFGGGTACYSSPEAAQKTLKAIEKYDSKYIELRGELVLKPVEATKDILHSLGLRVAK